MTSDMELVVDAEGDVRCVYGEELDLREIGKLQITRASHVEPDRDGYWWADMGPVDGPVFGALWQSVGGGEGVCAHQIASPAAPRGTDRYSANSHTSHHFTIPRITLKPPTRVEPPYSLAKRRRVL